MKYANLTATVAAVVISVASVAAFSSVGYAADVRPVLDTYSVDVNGNPDGFVAAVEKVFAKADALGIKSERGIYVSEIGGANTNTVYVLIEHENLGAMETSNANIFATEEWKTFQAAIKEMGQASTAREVVRELHRK